MKRGRRGGLLVALAALLGSGGTPFACSSSAGLSGQGGPCTQFSDCQEALICGKGPNGTGVCTNDPSSLEPAQGGADAAGNPGKTPVGDSGAMGTDDSSVPVGDGQAPEETPPPMTDAEVRDVGKPEDTGKPEDAGKPEDTGQPPEDTGTTQQEAAATPDAGGTDAASD